MQNTRGSQNTSVSKYKRLNGSVYEPSGYLSRFPEIIQGTLDKDCSVCFVGPWFGMKTATRFYFHEHAYNIRILFVSFDTPTYVILNFVDEIAIRRRLIAWLALRDIVERMERQTLARRLSKHEKAEQEEAAWGLVEAAC